jgi:hypothetical protein
MLLRPRDHRLDNLLRRPFRAEGVAHTPLITPLGSLLRLASGGDWGFAEYLKFQILSNEEAILPAEALYRPSHTTLFAQNSETGLQIVEDKFVTHDDTLVCTLSLRNAGEFAVPVEIAARWQVKKQEGLHRQAPPFDDLLQTLGPDSSTTLTFALSLHADTDIAWKRAVYWQGTPSPVRQQQERWERWAETQVPRFDCPDPWLVRLWYHEAAQHFERVVNLPSPSSPAAFTALSGFAECDFDQPLWPAPPAQAWVVSQLGLEITDDGVSLNPQISSWPYFCLDGVLLKDAESVMTVVWDDPEAPEDVYDDGDKGLTLYINGRKKFHQDELSPLSFTL